MGKYLFNKGLSFPCSREKAEILMICFLSKPVVYPATSESDPLLHLRGVFAETREAVQPRTLETNPK